MIQQLSGLKEKYRSLSPSLRASILFTICGLLQKGISFIVVPIYTRIMSAEDYGQYSVFLSWYQMITVFTTLNMWNYLINNGLTKYTHNRKQFISALQGLSTVITLGWFIVYIPLSGTWERLTGLSPFLMLLMFSELLVMPSYEYYCAVKRYDYQAEKVVVLTILLATLIPIVSIPLILAAQNKGIAAILGRVIVSIVIYGIIYIYILRDSRKLFNKEYWTFALKFNIPLIPHFLSVMILQQSDRIMIERMCGEVSAAIYSVAYQTACALQIANTAVLNSFIPYTYKAIQHGEKDRIGKLALPLLAGIGVLNIFAVLFAPEIINILAPEEYNAAIYIIPPVAMSNMFMFLFNLFANIEYYWGETRFVAIASFISAVVNVILNYIFIQRYGYIAAGYTTLVCYILFCICHYVFMRKVCRKYMDGYYVYNTKILIIISAFLTAIALGITLIYDYIIVRYVVIILCVLIFFCMRKKIVSVLKTMRKR